MLMRMSELMSKPRLAFRVKTKRVPLSTVNSLARGDSILLQQCIISRGVMRHLMLLKKPERNAIQFGLGRVRPPVWKVLLESSTFLGDKNSLLRCSLFYSCFSTRIYGHAGDHYGPCPYQSMHTYASQRIGKLARCKVQGSTRSRAGSDIDRYIGRQSMTVKQRLGILEETLSSVRMGLRDALIDSYQADVYVLWHGRYCESSKINITQRHLNWPSIARPSDIVLGSELLCFCRLH